MYNKALSELSAGDVIMELNAQAAALAAEIGSENVFNYSIGNPNLPPPPSVYEAIASVLKEEDQTAVHGYGPNAGIREVREAIAGHINSRFGQDLTYEDIFVVAGSCAGLSILLKALAVPGDEVICIAPYFTEYAAFLMAAGAKLVAVDADPQTFFPDVSAIREAISPRTRAVIVDSPNNPTGVIYPLDVLQDLAAMLREKETEYGHPIYLVSDEPYREIVFEGEDLPYLMDLYDDTIVSYSYSKSLSLAGQRIGYLAFSSRIAERKEIIRAVAGAGRIYGHTCAPTLFQRVLLHCIGDTADVSLYRQNRDLLVGQLEQCGFSFVPPHGAFYVMVKSPIPDAVAFARDAAQRHHLFFVPTDAFGTKGYVRLSYCVSPEMIRRSFPALEQLAKDYGLLQ